MFYLYRKTHLDTGLRYLGYTKRDDYDVYQGSGVGWQEHIKEHGYNVETELLKECESEAELKHYGLYYSELWDVKTSEEYANRKDESGSSGEYSDETKKKISVAAKERYRRDGPPPSAWTSERATEINIKSWQDPEIRRKRSEGISKALKGKKRGPASEETKAKQSAALKGKKINLGKTYTMKKIMCPHCGVCGAGGNMTRYHFDKCKQK